MKVNQSINQSLTYRVVIQGSENDKLNKEMNQMESIPERDE
jgi:hypothetical protein